MSRDLQHICVKSFVNKLHLILQISKIPSEKKLAFTHPGTKHGLYMRATVGVGRRLIAQLVAGRRQSRRKSGLSSQIILTRQPKTKPCMIIQHNRSPVSHYYEKKIHLSYASLIWHGDIVSDFHRNFRVLGSEFCCACASSSKISVKFIRN